MVLAMPNAAAIAVHLRNIRSLSINQDDRLNLAAMGKYVYIFLPEVMGWSF